MGAETELRVSFDRFNTGFDKFFFRERRHVETFHGSGETAGVSVGPEYGEAAVFLGQCLESFKTGNTVLGGIIYKGHIFIIIARSRKGVPFGGGQGRFFFGGLVGFYQVFTLLPHFLRVLGSVHHGITVQ